MKKFKKMVISPHIDDDVLGCGGIMDEDTYVLYVGNYEVYKLINDFLEHIDKIKPEELYVPHPSYNQDHRVVYEAAMIATRPHDNNHFVKKVLLYEQPQVYLWNTTNREFKPNYFVPIKIERKIEAYKLMKSQVRTFRSPSLIIDMSRVRGKQVGKEHSVEAFEILRWVD